MLKSTLVNDRETGKLKKVYYFESYRFILDGRRATIISSKATGDEVEDVEHTIKIGGEYTTYSMHLLLDLWREGRIKPLKI